MDAIDLEQLVQDLFLSIKEHTRLVYEQENEGVLHPPATEEEIAEYERRTGIRFPPLYQKFLKLHNGWEDYAYGFILIGVTGKHTEQALRDIEETVEIYLDSWIDHYGEPTPEKIAEHESKGNNVNSWEREGDLYIANKLHFGTNFNGDILFFNPAKTQQDGEMEVVYWGTSGGTYGRYSSFVEMLRADLMKLKKEIKAHS